MLTSRGLVGWTVAVLWELREGRLTFQEFQAACGGLATGSPWRRHRAVIVEDDHDGKTGFVTCMQ